MSRLNQSQVQSSNDYDKFKLIQTNREVVRGHVENLKKAFEEYGNLTEVQPILVNDRFEIIDGQHRFIACQELGETIYFTQLEGLGVAEARSMNYLHRGWHFDDYLKSYADGGDKNYRTFLDLKEDYGFTNGIILAYINGTEPSAPYRTFREGNFVISDLKAAIQRLDNLAEIREYTPLANDSTFALALLTIMRSENYNQSQMVKKMALFGDILRSYRNQADSLRVIEEVYNYKNSGDNRVRLY